MRSSQIKMRAAAQTGFSLIEIMLALAVIALGLVAIVGLIPTGVQASRDAADNTLAATILHDTLNGVRVQALTIWPPTTLTDPPLSLTGPQDICYDAAGTNQVPCTPSPPADTPYFHVKLIPQTSLSTPSLLVLTAVVSWPALSASPINNLTNFTQIANYQQ